MIKTKRTDPHRPGAIIPADYTYELSFWWGSSECPEGYGLEDLAELEKRHPRYRTAEIAGGRCDVCSSRYTHGGAFVHKPTGQTILVGRDCAAKYALLVNFAGFDAIKEMAKKATAAALTKRRNRARRWNFVVANPGLAAALDCGHRITDDLSEKLTQYGSLSAKQMDLAFKLYSETFCPPRPPRQADVNIPAPEGRLTVRGTVISLKEYSNDFGDTWKMTVKVVTDTGTWLCWGTAPASLFDCTVRSGQPVKGLEVEFTATLTRGREVHFALFKRPTGCKIVGGLREMEPRPGVAVTVCEQMNAGLR